MQRLTQIPAAAFIEEGAALLETTDPGDRAAALKELHVSTASKEVRDEPTVYPAFERGYELGLATGRALKEGTL